MLRELVEAVFAPLVLRWRAEGVGFVYWNEADERICEKVPHDHVIGAENITFLAKSPLEFQRMLLEASAFLHEGLGMDWKVSSLEVMHAATVPHPRQQVFVTNMAGQRVPLRQVYKLPLLGDVITDGVLVGAHIFS